MPSGDLYSLNYEQTYCISNVVYWKYVKYLSRIFFKPLRKMYFLSFEPPIYILLKTCLGSSNDDYFKRYNFWECHAIRFLYFASKTIWIWILDHYKGFSFPTLLGIQKRYGFFCWFLFTRNTKSKSSKRSFKDWKQGIFLTWLKKSTYRVYPITKIGLCTTLSIFSVFLHKRTSKQIYRYDLLQFMEFK